jgi:uncharacterized membrane protein
MSSSSGFIYVATYPDQAAATEDYVALMDINESKTLGAYDVATVLKDEDGKVHVNKHEKGTQQGAWGGILVGALVGVLFPPSVIAVGGAAAVGGIVGGLGGHFHEGLPRSAVKDLGELLESGQAALVVIGEATAKEALDKALTGAIKSTEAVFDADHAELTKELKEAEARLEAE